MGWTLLPAARLRSARGDNTGTRDPAHQALAQARTAESRGLVQAFLSEVELRRLGSQRTSPRPGCSREDCIDGLSAFARRTAHPEGGFSARPARRTTARPPWARSVGAWCRALAALNDPE